MTQSKKIEVTKQLQAWELDMDEARQIIRCQ